LADLNIVAGQTERFTATFKNEDGTPIDLTGATVTLESDGEAIANTPTITDAANGVVDVLIDAATTATITRRERVRFKRVMAGGDIALEPWFWLAPE
jgi:hypothetical protein